MKKMLLTASLFTAAGLLMAPALADDHGSSPATEQKPAENYKFPEIGTAPLVTTIEELDKITNNHGSEILVVNFWATFCGPCVEEMPYFVDLAKSNDRSDVTVLGISVDLRRDIDTRVIPFLKEREINYPNIVLFGNQQEAIAKFSEGWSGELPATFFYNKEGEKVGEFLRPVSREELNAKVSELLAAEKAA